MDIISLTLAFIIAFGSMFIGAISGGVGLVLRPLLVFLGFPALAVIASVRVASIVGDLPGIIILHKRKHIDWKLVKILVPPMFLGSIIAGIAILSVLKGHVEIVMGVILLLVGIILLSHKTIGLQEKKLHITKTRHIIGFFGTMIVSFFNTIVGGMGPMFSSLYITLYGKDYIKASAIGKTTSYIGIGLASALFIIGKAVDWNLCVVVAIGLGLGSFLGTKFGLAQGNNWIRTLVLVVVFASAIKLIFF